MQINNPLYKNIGIHVICSIFTVDKGVVKVLLIKRKNEPYKDKWALIGGGLYNEETVEDAMSREIYEKTGLKDVKIYFSNIESAVNRSPLKRMIAINFIGVIDIKRSILKDTEKTSNCDWFELGMAKCLAYDHDKILNEARQNLKKLIISSNVLKELFPSGFTLPELQKTYETILEKKIDRRNFRKKIINLGLIKETNKTEVFEGKKPAKKYEFNNVIEEKDIF